MDSPPTGYYAKWATPIFVEKTFTNGIRSVKFVKVFSLESFPLYGMRTVVSLNLSAYISLTYIVYYYVDYEKLTDEGVVEPTWIDIQKAIHKSPSGSVLRNLACVDMEVDLCSHTNAQDRSRKEVNFYNPCFKYYEAEIRIN